MLCKVACPIRCRVTSGRHWTWGCSWKFYRSSIRTPRCSRHKSKNLNLNIVFSRQDNCFRFSLLCIAATEAPLVLISDGAILPPRTLSFAMSTLSTRWFSNSLLGFPKIAWLWLVINLMADFKVLNLGGSIFGQEVSCRCFLHWLQHGPFHVNFNQPVPGTVGPVRCWICLSASSASYFSPQTLSSTWIVWICMDRNLVIWNPWVFTAW